jgi:sigma-B regulation protein RsbU (phosphoserine phosphatase)
LSWGEIDEDGLPQSEIRGEGTSERNRKTFMDVDELARENQLLRAQIDSLSRQLDSRETSLDSSRAIELAELIIENSTAVLFRRLADDDPQKRKMVYVSPNISRFGYQADDFLSNRVMFRDLVYSEDSDRTLREIQSFVDQGIDTYTTFYRIVTRQGDIRWVEDRTSIYQEPSTGQRYHQGIVIDIHEQKVAEEKLRVSEEKHRRIVETAGEGFVLMDDSFRIIAVNSTYVQLVKQSRSDLIGKYPFDFGFEECQHYWAGENISSGSHQISEFECELTAGDGKKVPVFIHASTLRSDNDEVIGNMAFVTDMTVQKKALRLAAEVQKDLLPERAPSLPGLDIAGKSLPCEEVGGDYFDYLCAQDGDDDISIVIGDIAGHGVDSALLMSSVRACLRMRVSHPGSINDIVSTVNQHLAEDVGESGRFMTLFYLDIHRQENRIEWIRAGHDPALFYDPVSDDFKELQGPGLVLGIDRDYPYVSQQLDGLRPGQIIALITDGIWEGCNQGGESFGKERVKDTIRKYSGASAELILEKIIEKFSKFTAGVVSEDDITLVIVKIV